MHGGVRGRRQKPPPTRSKANKVEPEVYKVINAILETEQSDITVVSSNCHLRCIGNESGREESCGSKDLVTRTVYQQNFKKKLSLKKWQKTSLIQTLSKTFQKFQSVS